MIRKSLIIGVPVLALWVGVISTTAMASGFTCEDRELTDYARPLKQMPASHLPGGQLPFAPRDVEWRSGPSVVVMDDSISYALALHRPISGNGLVARPAQLNWAIGARVELVNDRGRSISLVRRRQWRLGKLRYPERHLDVQVSPGLYRVSLKIRKFGGPLLARYWQFVRVLPLRENLRVGLRGGSHFKPGETLVARIENRGTTEARLPHGSGLAVERLQDGSWTRIEANEPPSTVFEDPVFLLGGRSSECTFFPIPLEVSSGVYRFSGVVETVFGKTRQIIRQFAVS